MERILLARGKVSDKDSKHSVGVSSAERVVKGCEFHNSGLGQRDTVGHSPGPSRSTLPQGMPRGAHRSVIFLRSTADLQ